MTDLLIRVNISREMSWLEDSYLKNYNVVVSSHIVEHLTKRVTSMLAKLQKPYIIDPYTYIFDCPINYSISERLFGKLLGIYGLDGMIKDPNNFQLSPEILVDNNSQPTNNLLELVENVINYQRTKIQDTYEEICEFEEFDNNTTILDLKPHWLIPPYFYLDAERNWLNVNIESIKSAIAIKNTSEKIFAVIMIDQEMLPYDEIDEIISIYNIDGVDGYLIWCVDFDERIAKKTDLDFFQRFIVKLAKNNKPIYNMYGGLFSLLLKNKGMSGATHSIGYGEHRNPFSQGGGMLVRFYQIQLHSFIPLQRKAEIEGALELDLCKCRYCTILNNNLANVNKLELAGKHFILNRTNEIGDIDSIGIEAFVNNLIEIERTVSQKDSTKVYANYYQRFLLWRNIILNQD